MMRTTINLPDDIYEAARSVANSRRISLGEAIGQLVRQGVRPTAGFKLEGRLPVAILPKDSPIITLEHTLAIEDDLD